MRGQRPRSAALAVALLLVGCTFPELPTPTPVPTATPSPSPTTAAPSPTASPTATAEPTPNRGAVPDVDAGEIAVTLIDGLRVRQRPGTEAPTVAGLLPTGFELEVVMGPFPSGPFSWHLVADPAPGGVDFDEGWVAAGYEPEPFLRGTGRRQPETPSLLSMAGSGAAEEGPVTIDEGEYIVRWIAVDPERIGCRFAVSLTPAGGEPVATIRATIGAGIDRGTLQPQTFAALGVRGPTFVEVESDCDWALVLARFEPAADPSSTPAP